MAKSAALKRRTTLTLPAESLRKIQAIANSRHVNLSTAISAVIDDGLRLESARQRRKEVLNNFRRAFHGFSTDELALLDGVILEPAHSNRRK